MHHRPVQILIVDDEASLRSQLAGWLEEEHGYIVEATANGTEALELLAAKGSFDVVLLDYLLPAPYNGLTLMKEIENRSADVPAFIMFTGWGLDNRVGVEALKAGAYRYLAKPFDPEELAILIQSIVEIRQTEERLATTAREKAWMESLLEVSKSVNSTLELDKLLQLILDEMKRVVIYDSASIQIITDQGLEIVACRGFPNPERVLGRVFAAKDEYPNYLVWKSKQTLIEPEVRAGNRTRRFDGWMGVPLMYRDQAIGVITLDSQTTGLYNEADARVATIFANQAAVAVMNARLHQQIQKRANALHRLLEVGQQITRITDHPRQALETIVRMACQLASADCVVIYPYHAERKVYDRDNVTYFGLRHEFIPKDKPREYGTSVAARIIRQSAGICIVPDVTQDAERGLQGKSLRESPFIVREGIQAFVAIRLDFGTEPVGVLFVNFRDRQDFTQDEVEIIHLLANQAAVAISNARLYGRTSERLERKVAELQTVSEINQHLTSTLDINEVLSLILDKAMELSKVRNSVLQGLDDETGELVVQLRKDPVPVPLKQPRLKLGEGITGKAAQEKRSIIVHDVTQLPWRDIYCEFWPETRSELAVPLLIGEQCIGVLNLEHPKPGYFSEEERELIEGLAAQAAIAIQNAQLYKSVIRRSEHLKALHEASKAITAGFTAERKLVLDRIVKQAVERITSVEGPKALWSAILLYDETAHELRLESVYPADVLSGPTSGLDRAISLNRDTAPGGRIGIAGRTFLEGKPQRVDDVADDFDYVGFNATTRSGLDVPLIDSDKIIGVLSVESDQVRAFDEDDEQALQGLADLSVIAIKNAEQAERLNRANAVALMGAWGADVAHDVNREVGAIRRAVFVLQRRPDLPSEVKERLQDIDRCADRLALPELPAQAPQFGHSLAFRDAPLVDRVIQTEVQMLQSAHPLPTLRLEQACTGIRVAIHEQWLRRLLRHLIRNSVKAAPPEKNETLLVTIRTAVQGSMAEVYVEDTGLGVRPEIVPLLFQQPIAHEDGRLGRGLLLVRFLAEQHGGYVRLVWNQPGRGACFAFGIPQAQPMADSL